MSRISNIKKRTILSLVNHFFSGTHFYSIKRWLLNRIKDVKLEQNVRIVGPIVFFGTLSVGEDTFVGRDFNIEGNGNVCIGRKCDIAPHVCIITGSHEVGDKYRRAGKGYSGKVTVGNGCWICANSCILPNVEIGEGSVVAAKSLVNKSVSDNCLVAGNPARVKKIFND